MGGLEGLQGKLLSGYRAAFREEEVAVGLLLACVHGTMVVDEIAVVVYLCECKYSLQLPRV